MIYQIMNAGDGVWKNAVRRIDNDSISCIPADPTNTDYQAYLKWLEEGNTPEPADKVQNS